MDIIEKFFPKFILIVVGGLLIFVIAGVITSAIFNCLQIEKVASAKTCYGKVLISSWTNNANQIMALKACKNLNGVIDNF